MAFGICWFNDKSIFRTLDSIPKHFKIIVVDGKFKMIKSDNELSDEGLRERVRSYDNVELVNAPNLSESEKRNVYLSRMKDYKYCFIIDSDEYIKRASWKNLLFTLGFYDSGLYQVILERTDNRVGSYPRILVNPSEWEYGKAHDIFINKNTGIAKRGSTLTGIILDTIVIAEDNKLRDKDYIDMIDQYQLKVWHEEKKHWDELIAK